MSARRRDDAFLLPYCGAYRAVGRDWQGNLVPERTGFMGIITIGLPRNEWERADVCGPLMMYFGDGKLSTITVQAMERAIETGELVRE